MLAAFAGSTAFASSARAQASPPAGTAAKTIPTIDPPDPNPKVPDFKLPPKSCDTHTHIFGPASRYPFAPNRPYSPPEAPLEAFRALHETIGVERCVIVNATVHGTDNRVVTNAIAQSGGVYKGVANVSDEMSDKELQALDKGGIRGCRFAFLKRLGGVGDMNKFNRIVHRVAELGWHVDVYFEPGTVGVFASTLSALPAPYVIDHMGTVLAAKGRDDPSFRALLEQLGIDPNKEGAAFEYGPVGDGCHLYGGWFYLVGEMVTAGERNLSAPDCHDDAQHFEFFFTRSHPNAEAFRGGPMLAIEFTAHVKWVLPESPEYRTTSGETLGPSDPGK